MVGARIRKLRGDSGVTQKDLAAYLGVSPSAVGMYEQERRMPDIETIGKLCRKFGTTSDFLLFGIGAPEEESATQFADETEKRAGERKLYKNNKDGGKQYLTPEETVEMCKAIRLAMAMSLKVNI